MFKRTAVPPVGPSEHQARQPLNMALGPNMERLEVFPFNKLHLSDDESVVWIGHSWAFHRTGDHGILVSDLAVYCYSPFWLWLAKWRRFPIQSIKTARFRDSRWRPCLILETSEGQFKFRTPFDSYSEEMNIDRKMLKDAAEAVTRTVSLNNLHELGPN
jgi:hypothetical protein